jgi:hypothetical protein
VLQIAGQVLSRFQPNLCLETLWLRIFMPGVYASVQLHHKDVSAAVAAHRTTILARG